MTILIKDREITLKYTFRSMMIYEGIMKQSFTPNGITEIIVYFYSTVLASSKGMDLSFDEFMDYLDENPNMINDFNVWLMSVLDKNGYINQNEQMGEDVDPKKS